MKLDDDDDEIEEFQNSCLVGEFKNDGDVSEICDLACKCGTSLVNDFIASK